MALGGPAELVLLGLCWFPNSGASWAKSETGPCMWRARRDPRKRQIAPDL